MDKRKVKKYFLALSAVLSLLPLLFSAQNFQRLYKGYQNRSQVFLEMPCDLQKDAKIVIAEKNILTNNIRIIRSNKIQRQYQPNCCDYGFKGSSWLLRQPFFLFVFIYPAIMGICHSRRFIIKYIHDQDGHKI